MKAKRKKKKRLPTKAEILKKEKKKAKAEYNKALHRWTTLVKERDNYTCQICKKYLKDNPHNCHAHHILDKKNFKQYSTDLNNGITLCYYCHKCGPKAPHMNAIFFANWLKINKPNILYYLNLELAKTLGVAPER